MHIVDLGLTDFRDVHSFQLDLVHKISHGLMDNTLIITEHKPVITIGRKGRWDNIFRSKEELDSLGIEVFEIDRGGDVTYHGPGQIVAYPVVRLENEAKDIHVFLQYMEDIGRDFLLQYGVFTNIKPGFRGVWVKDKKIISIGIGVKKWVAYHGMAVNINLDMVPFSFIKPCGIDNVQMVSLEDILGYKIGIEDAKVRIKRSFKKIPFMAKAKGQV